MAMNLRWKLYDFYITQFLYLGFKYGYIQPYSEKLIEKLRDIYYGSVPASVLLLCRSLTDGYCYDRAFLMSRAFLDDETDVKLVFASIIDLKLNPIYRNDNRSSDHCFVETTENGKHFIYDTSMGLRYDKWIYWLMNFPKIRLIREKDSIIKRIEEESDVCLENNPYIDNDFILKLIIPSIEANYGKKGEMYSMPGYEVLQREVELFREKISHPQEV